MAFLKRTAVVVLSYIVACFAASLVWLVLGLLVRGSATVDGYDAIDVVTMTGFVFLFAGLGSLIAILIAEWRGISSRLYYGVGGIVVAFFTVGWFANGAFEPNGIGEYLAYAVAGGVGGLTFHTLARRGVPVRQIQPAAIVAQ